MDVYWCVFPTVMINDSNQQLPLINYYEPSPGYEKIKNIKDTENSGFKMCPSIKEQQKNVFNLKFPFDYELSFTNDTVQSSMYDQYFFDSYVKIRSVKDKILSFSTYYGFFTEEDLQIQVTGCYLADNDFVNKTVFFPGTYNISKWFRPLECSYYLKRCVDNITIDRGDEYLSVQFLTNEKITLKKFYLTDRLKEISQSILASKSYKSKSVYKLSQWYDMFNQSKFRSLILKEIKNNLL